MKKIIFLLILNLLFLGLFSKHSLAADDTGDNIPFYISSGFKEGIYFQVTNIICIVLSTDNCINQGGIGAVDNIKQLNTGNSNFAITQMDTFLNAVEGKAEFFLPNDKKSFSDPNNKLKVIIPLFVESFNILVKKNNNANRVLDLLNKPVVMRNSAYSVYFIFTLLNKHYLSIENLKNITVSKESSRSLLEKLCDNKIEALVFIASHPHNAIKDSFQNPNCELKFLPVLLYKEITKNTHYFPSIIKASQYDKNALDVTSVGLYSLLISTDDVSEAEVYKFLTTYFINFDKINKDTPAELVSLEQVKKSLDNDFFKDSYLHKGAIKFFKEKGLL